MSLRKHNWFETLHKNNRYMNTTKIVKCRIHWKTKNNSFSIQVVNAKPNSMTCEEGGKRLKLLQR